MYARCCRRAGQVAHQLLGWWVPAISCFVFVISSRRNNHGGASRTNFIVKTHRRDSPAARSNTNRPACSQLLKHTVITNTNQYADSRGRPLSCGLVGLRKNPGTPTANVRVYYRETFRGVCVCVCVWGNIARSHVVRTEKTVRTRARISSPNIPRSARIIIIFRIQNAKRGFIRSDR